MANKPPSSHPLTNNVVFGQGQDVPNLEEQASSFRIILEPDFEFSDRELDWIDGRHQWRLSDKEYGSVTWFYDREPQESDISALREFFEIDQHVDLTTLAKLNPGEIAQLHAETHDMPRVVAKRCPHCGSDWLVFRQEGTAWLKYGRRCEDGGWWLGSATLGDEIME